MVHSLSRISAENWFKYNLEIKDRQIIEMPYNSEIISVKNDKEIIYAYGRLLKRITK
jgi:hypothetical protein